MQTYCTRPECSQPLNNFSELDDPSKLPTAQQKYCHCCGMPQILAGRYIPQQLLGKGGFGAAYLACDRHTTKLRKCVVKQFQPPDHLNEKTLNIAEELFTREAEVLESLGNEHPQIPDLYAFFPLILSEENDSENEFFYLVQEFIDGETLEQEVQKKGHFNEAEVLEVLENMLQVLQFVHDHHSIHRDIKPSNIMRDRQGKLYLLDFGAVKRVTGAGTSPYSSTGIYSFGFAPPEQMQGRQVYPSTDLYALAATCLRLLTGKPIQELYDSYNNQWAWRRHTEISDNLATILERMLFATPKERFLSAQAVLNAIQDNPVSKATIETPQTDSFEKPLLSQPEAGALFSLSTDYPDDNSPTEIEESNHQNQEAVFSSSETVEKPEEITSNQATAVQSHENAAAAPSTQEQTPEPAAVASTPTQNQDSLATSENSRNDSLNPQTASPPAFRHVRRFTLWELIGNAGFTGFEGALLLIALTSVFANPAISIGLWGMSMGGLIYAQFRRFIEKMDLLIVAGLTLVMVALVPPLRSLPISMAIISSIVASAGAIALISCFRLIYRLFSK